MRDIPIIFPISLAVIVALLLFTSAYAISANAVEGESPYSSTFAPAGVVVPLDQNGGDSTGDSAGYSWYEKTALFVCPLH